MSAPLLLDHLKDERGEDELHRQVQLVARADNGVGPRHEALRDHREQIGKVDSARLGKPDDEHGFVGGRNPAGDERV